MSLATKLKRTSVHCQEMHDRLFSEGKIKKSQRAELLELRRLWRSGEICSGSHSISKQIQSDFGVSVPPSTIQSWLGIRD